MRRTVLMMSGNGPPVIDGVGHHTARLLAGLAAARPEWRWVWLRRKRRWFTAPLSYRGRVMAVQPWHAWSRFGIRLAVVAARLIRPDLLHVQEQTHSFHESPAAAAVANTVPCSRVVATVHEVHPELSGSRWTLELVRRAGRVYGSDSATAEKCRMHLGRDPDGLFWSPTNILPPAETVRSRPGLVVTFGFLNAIKGIEAVFPALARAKERIPELRWRIVGPFHPDRDPYHAELARRVRGDWIEFTGGRDDLDDPTLRTWLAEAAVMVLPFADGASIRRTTLQTAWAFGIPTVTTPPPPGESGVVPGVNCTTAPLDRPDLWESAVTELLANPTTAARLAAGSRAAGERFGWDRLVAVHLRVYDDLLRDLKA